MTQKLASVERRETENRPKRKMGRKPMVLRPEIREAILEHVRKGNYIKTACEAVGINPQTLYNWEQYAEEYRLNPDSSSSRTEYGKAYYDFVQELKRARAENVSLHVANIQEASKKQGQWTASAWLLERMNPSDYGRRMELEVGPSKVLVALQEQAGKWTQLPVVETVKELPEGQESV